MNLYVCYRYSYVSLSAYVTLLKKNSLLIRQPTLVAALSKVARLLQLQVRISPGQGCVSLVSVVCC